MTAAKGLLVSLRPAQWVKNLLIFAALVFGHRAGDPAAVTLAVGAFLAFCAAASGIYLLNDIRDRDSDRQHPLKMNRPIAAGVVKTSLAGAVSIKLIAIALVGAYFINLPFFYALIAFVLLQFGYSFGLKRIVIIDVFCVALGFVLRAVSGAYVIDVEISPWLLVCSLTLALFLALGKRRHEVVLLEERAEEHRASLSQYTPYFLDQLIAVVTAATVMAYALYTLSPATIAKFGTHDLVFTLPFVIYGVFRYLYLVHQKEGGDNPTRMFLTDPALLVNTALWLAVSAWIVYGR